MNTQTIKITLTINNTARKFFVSEVESLLDVLRRASYFSVKRGCDDGSCGVCVVLVNGKPVRSCMVKAVDAVGTSITTIE
ncbi:MAG: 2Fe-2S iron-sulfur cluster-binding protein, partial [Anaerolineales bacterium]